MRLVFLLTKKPTATSRIPKNIEESRISLATNPLVEYSLRLVVGDGARFDLHVRRVSRRLGRHLRVGLKMEMYHIGSNLYIISRKCESDNMLLHEPRLFFLTVSDKIPCLPRTWPPWIASRELRWSSVPSRCSVVPPCPRHESTRGMGT